MKVLLSVAAVALLAGVLATPAAAKPPPHHRHHVVRHGHYVVHYVPAPPEFATIHLHGGSVGFIVGVGGADGYIDFRGARYPIEVSGLKVGTIGVSAYDLDGRVYHLRHVEDIEGDYSAGEASATAIAGGGSIDMTNGRGVEIQASSTSGGLQLTLGGGGVTIRLKR